MKSANKNAAGPALLAGDSQAKSATQAAWRFLNNEGITLADLVEPLREAGREAAKASESSFILLAHDWSKLDFYRHNSKQDLKQITHEYDIGYELAGSLLIDAASGATIAPMQMHLRTKSEVHSTGIKKPLQASHRLDDVAQTMEEAKSWELEKKIVHIIDREADSLGRMRQWDSAGHLFLVRCDDRRVNWNGQPILLSEIASQFDRDFVFQYGGQALYHGKPVRQEVAECEVVLNRPHSVVVKGKKKSVLGRPITVRLVITRLIDDDGYIVAEWMLLTNVMDVSVTSYQIALWYYWRWLIETFFKLLKSHGQELEQWQQQTGEAIARRILVASMACVVVFDLQQDNSAEGIETRKLLVRLSGRQMKYGCISTIPALLAGYMTLLSVTDLLTQTDVDIGKLKRIAKKLDPCRLV